MTTIMIEGFEQIDPGYELTAELMKLLLQGMEPDYDTDWFQGSGDSVAHVSGAGRISGNCLRFTRGAQASPSWSADYLANLGFAFIPKQKMTLGFGLRYSAAPTTPIPICGFRYDKGDGDQEQISLWATPDAKLYISTVPYTHVGANIVVGLNPISVTPAGAFRFTVWTYLELVVDYSGEIPTVSVRVNGEPVLENLIDMSLLQLQDDPYVSSGHIFNPTNEQFGGIGFYQDIDDLYMDDASTRGPQWIIPLSTDGVAVTSGAGSWTGIPDESYPSLGSVYATDWDTTIKWPLSNLPADVGTVMAIGVNMIAQQPGQIDAVTFGVSGPSDFQVRGKRITVSAGGGPRCFRFCTNSPPLGVTMTRAGISAMRGYIAASYL